MYVKEKTEYGIRLSHMGSEKGIRDSLSGGGDIANALNIKVWKQHPKY